MRHGLRAALTFCVALGGCSWDASLAAQKSENADASSPSCAFTTDTPLATRDAGTPIANGSAAAISVLTWNLDWFQDPSEGPSDDRAQYRAVRETLADSHATLIALEEVASEPAFERLLHDLPDYAGVLSGYAWTQRTALLWNRQRFELSAAHAISGLDDAGRPPLQVSLRNRADESVWLVVVVHAKAQADTASHERRVQLSRGLHDYLAAQHPGAATLVLGDFNDRLSGSITRGAESPYRNFVDDPHYFAATLGLDAASAPESSYAWGSTIDHILVSDALAPLVNDSSVNVLREELLSAYPTYQETVSDHFPVEVTLQP